MSRAPFLQILQRSEHLALENRSEVYPLLRPIVELQHQRVRRHDREALHSVNRMVHSFNLHLPQWFNLERRTAEMQESPVVQKFGTMDLCPRFDEALLRPWQSAADTFDRVESEHRFEFLVRRVEVWPVMRCTVFWKHADDPKEARDFRHGLLFIVVGDSRRANLVRLTRGGRSRCF